MNLLLENYFESTQSVALPVQVGMLTYSTIGIGLRASNGLLTRHYPLVLPEDGNPHSEAEYIAVPIIGTICAVHISGQRP